MDGGLFKVTLQTSGATENLEHVGVTRKCTGIRPSDGGVGCERAGSGLTLQHRPTSALRGLQSCNAPRKMMRFVSWCRRRIDKRAPLLHRAADIRSGIASAISSEAVVLSLESPRDHLGVSFR